MLSADVVLRVFQFMARERVSQIILKFNYTIIEDAVSAFLYTVIFVYFLRTITKTGIREECAFICS